MVARPLSAKVHQVSCELLLRAWQCRSIWLTVCIVSEHRPVTSVVLPSNLVEERRSVVARPLSAKVHQVSCELLLRAWQCRSIWLTVCIVSEHRLVTSVARSPCLVPGLLAKPKALITPSAFISKIPVLMKSSALSKRVPSPSLPENDAQELALDASLRASARQSKMNAMRRNGGKTFGITAETGGKWLTMISTARLQAMVPDHSPIVPRSTDQTYYAADGQLVRRRSVRWPADGRVVTRLRRFKDCKDSVSHLMLLAVNLC